MARRGAAAACVDRLRTLAGWLSPARARPPLPLLPAPQLYLRFGLPALRPFPAALQPWIQAAAQSNEFHALLLAPLLLQAPQLWVGVVPLSLLALYPTLDALRARCGGMPAWRAYGAPTQAALEANKAREGRARGLWPAAPQLHGAVCASPASIACASCCRRRCALHASLPSLCSPRSCASAPQWKSRSGLATAPLPLARRRLLASTALAGPHAGWQRPPPTLHRIRRPPRPAPRPPSFARRWASSLLWV